MPFVYKNWPYVLKKDSRDQPSLSICAAAEKITKRFKQSVDFLARATCVFLLDF